MSESDTDTKTPTVPRLPVKTKKAPRLPVKTNPPGNTKRKAAKRRLAYNKDWERQFDWLACQDGMS